MVSNVQVQVDSLLCNSRKLTGILLVGDGTCPQIRELLASAEAPVLWLDGSVPPLLEVSRALEHERLKGSSIHTLHWFSHGAPGRLRVGNTWIHRSCLLERAHVLSQWGLRDLALWSCEAGADRNFVESWEEITAARVWSSASTLGALRDGEQNWMLNSHHSDTRLFPPLSPNVIKRWQGQLGLITSPNQPTIPGSTTGETKNDRAFAALKNDGSVVTWGNPTNGGNSSAVRNKLNNIAQIFSNLTAFAALKEDGTVVSWGNADNGGDSSDVSAKLTGVKEIFSTGSAFAALKSNGSVITWGQGGDTSDFINFTPNEGGDSSTVSDDLQSGVSKIFSTRNAFAALKDNGSVVTWGNSSGGGRFLFCERPASVERCIDSQ